MKKGKYASKEGLLTLEVGEYIKFDGDDDVADLCEIHRVLTGWIYVFSDSEVFVPDVLNIETHSNNFPLSR